MDSIIKSIKDLRAKYNNVDIVGTLGHNESQINDFGFIKPIPMVSVYFFRCLQFQLTHFV